MAENKSEQPGTLSPDLLTALQKMGESCRRAEVWDKLSEQLNLHELPIVDCSHVDGELAAFPPGSAGLSTPPNGRLASQKNK